MSAMSQIDLQLFGYPKIRVDGRPVSLPLRKALAALTYVIEAQTPVSRDAVATLLWPEADEATARSRLRRLLHRTHQHLGVGIIASDRISLCAAPGIELRVDTQTFEQACQEGDFANASRLYRADYLGTFSVEGCPDFDDWAFFRREALRSRFIHAIERLIEAKRLCAEGARHFAWPGHRGTHEYTNTLPGCGDSPYLLRKQRGRPHRLPGHRQRAA